MSRMRARATLPVAVRARSPDFVPEPAVAGRNRGLPCKRRSSPVYQLAEKIIFRRLLKNAQMQGPRSVFHLPNRQAILRSEAPADNCRDRNDEG